MEPRDAFQNIYHSEFWSPIDKVLGPNSANKIFSKYYHYCNFVYIKCVIIMHLHTELYHYGKNQKKKLNGCQDQSIHVSGPSLKQNASFWGQ